MITNQVINSVRQNVWSRGSRFMSDNKVSTAEKVAAMSPEELIKNNLRVSDWNKKLLVFSGRYKTKAEIPDVLPYEVLSKARNWVRVKVCNYIILAAAVGFIAVSVRSKREVEGGASLTQIGLDWHLDYNSKAKAEATKAAEK